MEVGICCNWILGVSQVPNVDVLVAIIVISYDKLSRDDRVPDNLCFHRFQRLLFIVVVRVEVVKLARCRSLGLCKLEN